MCVSCLNFNASRWMNDYSYIHYSFGLPINSIINYNVGQVRVTMLTKLNYDFFKKHYVHVNKRNDGKIIVIIVLLEIGQRRR